VSYQKVSDRFILTSIQVWKSAAFTRNYWRATSYYSLSRFYFARSYFWPFVCVARVTSTETWGSNTSKFLSTRRLHLVPRAQLLRLLCAEEKWKSLS